MDAGICSTLFLRLELTMAQSFGLLSYLHKYAMCVLLIYCSLCIFTLQCNTRTGNSTGKLGGGENLCTRCNKRKESGELLIYLNLARGMQHSMNLIILTQSLISLLHTPPTQIIYKSLNCLRLASRIDAVSSRLETAVRMNTVTKSMKGVVKGMDKGLASMDVDKISATMDKFEQQFEDLDVKAAYMDQAMNATTANATPVDQVDQLVMMVADENNLELGEAFGDLGPVGKIKEPETKVEEEPVADDLEARLANLRG